MALRLAVVVSQAPGLGGTPSAGHRWTAAANASAAASSARSRSPKRLVREATTRAHSSWCALVIASRTSTTLTGVGPVVDHGNQVLHLESSPVVRGALVGSLSPLLRTPLRRSDTASRISAACRQTRDLVLERHDRGEAIVDDDVRCGGFHLEPHAGSERLKVS